MAAPATMETSYRANSKRASFLDLPPNIRRRIYLLGDTFYRLEAFPDSSSSSEEGGYILAKGARNYMLNGKYGVCSKDHEYIDYKYSEWIDTWDEMQKVRGEDSGEEDWTGDVLESDEDDEDEDEEYWTRWDSKGYFLQFHDALVTRSWNTGINMSKGRTHSIMSLLLSCSAINREISDLLYTNTFFSVVSIDGRMLSELKTIRTNWLPNIRNLSVFICHEPQRLRSYCWRGKTIRCPCAKDDPKCNKNRTTRDYTKYIHEWQSFVYSLVQNWKNSPRDISRHFSMTMTKRHLHEYKDILSPLRQLSGCLDSFSVSFTRQGNSLQVVDDEIRKYTRETSKIIVKTKPMQPFRYLDMPEEIQLSILSFTDLVVPDKSIAWGCFRCIAVPQGKCCGSCRSDDWRLDCCCPLQNLSCRDLPTARRGPLSFSSSCKYMRGFRDYFLVSKRFREQALQTFYSENHFVFDARVNCVSFGLRGYRHGRQHSHRSYRSQYRLARTYIRSVLIRCHLWTPNAKVLADDDDPHYISENRDVLLVFLERLLKDIGVRDRLRLVIEVEFPQGIPMNKGDVKGRDGLRERILQQFTLLAKSLPRNFCKHLLVNIFEFATSPDYFKFGEGYAKKDAEGRQDIINLERRCEEILKGRGYRVDPQWEREVLKRGSAIIKREPRCCPTWEDINVDVRY